MKRKFNQSHSRGRHTPTTRPAVAVDSRRLKATIFAGSPVMFDGGVPGLGSNAWRAFPSTLSDAMFSAAASETVRGDGNTSSASDSVDDDDFVRGGQVCPVVAGCCPTSLHLDDASGHFHDDGDPPIAELSERPMRFDS